MKVARLSGYDAAAGICWQFRNKGDARKPRLGRRLGEGQLRGTPRDPNAVKT
jgi:hypothetical protein